LKALLRLSRVVAQIDTRIERAFAIGNSAAIAAAPDIFRASLPSVGIVNAARPRRVFLRTGALRGAFCASRSLSLLPAFLAPQH
jgi:hypothetical protein